MQILLIYVFGVRRQDSATKRKVSIFLYCSVSYFLIGIYVSDKTRKGCELGDKNVAIGHSAFTWCTGPDTDDVKQKNKP